MDVFSMEPQGFGLVQIYERHQSDVFDAFRRRNGTDSPTRRNPSFSSIMLQMTSFLDRSRSML
jgi:hypothetical protein